MRRSISARARECQAPANHTVTDVGAQHAAPDVHERQIVGATGRSPKLQRGAEVPHSTACASFVLLFALTMFCVSTRAAAPDAQKVYPEKYEIEVRFEPEKSFLHARAAVTLRVEQKTDAMEFELNPRLKILSVSDAQGRNLEFTRSGRIGSARLLVRLAEPAAPEQGFTVTFEYEGTLPRGQLDYITKDGILLRDESRWYPVVDVFGFTSNFVRIVLPPFSGWDFAVSSDGGVVEDGSHQTEYSFSSSRPVSSRAIAGIPKKGPCSMLPGQVAMNAPSRGFHVTLCAGTPDDKSSSTINSNALQILQYYNNAYGSYVSPSFVMLKGFAGQQGAIGYSAPGFLVVSEDVIKYHDYPGWAPEFLPHEIAHQWFPIEVTLTRPEDGWLAESLAEYLAWRYLQEKQPEQARRMVQRAMRDALAPEPMRALSLGTRLFNEPWNVAYATLYQRGLLVWRTLETVIDRERVDRALREYYKRFAGRSASIADFRKICEEISGRDLGWFFEYFLNGTQIPEISLRRLPSDAPNVLLGEIVVKNVPADFQVRVEMRVQTEKGAVEHSVATRGEVTPFSLNLPAPATLVMLDPDARLLRWTEAARRNREQLKLLQQINDLEDSDQFRDAAALGARALALDAEDLAANHQHIHFLMGRMYFLAGKLAAARKEFSRALELASLDTMDTDFYRVWAHVYRAQIAKRLGQTAAALREARAGLAGNSPAMEMIISWNEAPDYERSARQELRKLAAATPK